VLLPTEARLRWLLETAARLVSGGTEPVSGLVLPDADHFPDVFDGTPAAVDRLLARVLRHAGLTDASVAVAVAGELAGGGGCGTGSCGVPTAGPRHRVERSSDGYRVNVSAAEIGHPTVLTTALVRATSHLFLLEAELYEDFEPRQAEQVIDMASVLLGFGVLVCNGSYIYSKSCGGVSVASATALPVEELAVALAIHCALHHVDARAARRALDPTPRDHFDEARRWVTSNSGLVRLVRTDPEAVLAGSYALGEARGWLARWLGVGKARGPSVPTDAEIEQMARRMVAPKPARGEARARRLAEIRELVDESLPAGPAMGHSREP